MMKHVFLSIAAILCFGLVSNETAWAGREARPIKIDHRVRTVMYQPDEVYKFTGHYRYQSSIEFEEGETIQTISMGDSTAWMLNPTGNRLFLKPIEQDATTNMTLITNRRTYLLELHARETDDIQDKDMVFIMRFIYPDSEQAKGLSQHIDPVPSPDLEENAEKYNFNYTIAGTEQYAPIRIFDDGEFTFFQFKNKNADIPAFYWVDDQGNEAMINYRTRGDYIVVERVSKRMTLRYGNNVVCVFNETMLSRTPR
ncbi:MAG: P-type conjugative transfer protein VirB9 [Rickettsiales bacterium]|jgi:type IV secretion system protein VirB9|nr:P-type conjugative transfer protein VirB9 [Rickettsiales bacterium]